MLVKLRDGSSIRAGDVTSIEVNPNEFLTSTAVIVNLVMGSIGARIFLFEDVISAREYASELHESVNAALREAAVCHDVPSPTMPNLAPIMDDSAR